MLDPSDKSQARSTDSLEILSDPTFTWGKQQILMKNYVAWLVSLIKLIEQASSTSTTFLLHSPMQKCREASSL